MRWQLIGYAVACVVTPVVWGLLVVWAANRVERVVQKRRAASSASEVKAFPPIDYHI
jgi:hypothetical protein